MEIPADLYTPRAILADPSRILGLPGRGGQLSLEIPTDLYTPRAHLAPNDVRRLEGAQHARLRNRFKFLNNKENYGYCGYFCTPFSRCAEVVCFYLILHILLSNIYRRVGYFVRIFFVFLLLVSPGKKTNCFVRVCFFSFVSPENKKQIVCFRKKQKPNFYRRIEKKLTVVRISHVGP